MFRTGFRPTARPGCLEAPRQQQRWITIRFAVSALAGLGLLAVDYLRQHVREHWDVLRHVQPKDTAFGSLTLLEKTRVPEDGSVPRPAHRKG